MHKKCIFCKEELDGIKISSEHIIPKCMGGRLKSNSIICRKCNNKFGTEFDESLIERYRLIIHPIRLYNPKLKTGDVVVELNGEKILLTTEGIKLKDPYSKNEKGGFGSMIFPDINSMKKVLKKMKKKDPKIDIQATINSSTKTEKEIKDYVIFSSKAINNQVYRCCGKIGFEYLCYVHPNYEPSSFKFRKFVLGDLESKDFPICIWYSNYFPLENLQDSIYHLIVVEGRKKERILIGYLIVFNLLQTLMVFDIDYDGPDFIKGYYHDLLNNYEKEFETSKSIPLRRDSILRLIENFDPNDVKEEYEKVFGFMIYKSRCLPIKKELERLVEKLLSKLNLPFDGSMGLLEFVYKDIIKILKKYGLYILYRDQIEAIVENSYEITLREKLTLIFNFLMHYFLEAKLSIDPFEKLSKIINT